MNQTYNSPSCVKEEPKKTPEVQEVLQELKEELSCLDSQIAHLHNRLNPVMSDQDQPRAQV